jgi:NADH-quinone oxidoreductase subunit N
MNTLIAIIGLGVLCLLFEIFNLRKGIIPVTNWFIAVLV